MDPAPPPARRLRVWDLPTRVFHWALVVAVVAAVVSAKLGGNAMVWHLRCGYAVLTLLAFRVIWGIVGGHWSRWTTLAPGAWWRYLRAQPRPAERFDVGHNPLGAWSVLALMAWLSAQVATGLVANDEIFTTGPLVRLVSTATSERATAHHTEWGVLGVYLWIALHIAAIGWHQSVRRHAIVRAMFTGDRTLPATAGTTPPASRDTAATRLLALAIGLACAAGVALLVAWGQGTVTP